MARITLEEKLGEVNKLAHEKLSPKIIVLLSDYLSDSNNMVAGRAAEIIAQSGEESFIVPLLTAFQRLVTHPQPVTVDKLCHAKETIILALHALRCADSTPFLAGVRCVQMEPVFGGRSDTAAALRAHCATALAQKRDPEAHFALAELLFDPEIQPRQAAIKGLAYLAGEKSELLLRMKLLVGDVESDLLIEAMNSLLQVDADHSLDFIAKFLNSPDSQMVEIAALALGQSRLEEAYPLLRVRWESNSDLALRKSLLLAMALTRRDEAFDYLLEILREEAETTAAHACDALALFGVDRRYRERIAAVISVRKNARLTDIFNSHFPPGP